MESQKGDDLPLGASWLSSSASPVRRAASIRSSIHPSVDHQRRYRTGIINLDYLKKRWWWGGPSCSVAGALVGDSNKAQTFWPLTSPFNRISLSWPAAARRGRSGLTAFHLFLFHTSISSRREHWQAGTDVAASAGWILHVLPRCGQKLKTELFGHTLPSVWILKSLSESRTDDIKQKSDFFFPPPLM